ncbi:poly(A) polymerase [Octadecabacter temperatus]|uniref:CCA-adding enzyme n=1 Tax=Octadecabacter temperatus TaxID=1458307 RepID=A0A0K0Y9T0_9RHOB|nr:CCA tRNA nucleotidyltransferase [Octadecabacter temperatus]AKS47703.1 CCA-adding enzyme [Octadecabacter temperatus]SIO39646.1 poly(A) polymerase [Octadecabacter temperatus]
MTGKARSLWRTDGTLRHVGEPQWLTNEILQSLMAAFEDAGFQIYAVGGCVRDTILNRPVSDVDLSTDALPGDTVKIIESLQFRNDVWKAIPTGAEHGTITALAPSVGGTYEITTFRTDAETDGRHAIVAFSKNLEDDAMRRDFTINAFYADREGCVRDLVGGSADLAARKVRFIGDPIERIQEDYLRILRFFRFIATLGTYKNGIDQDGLAACAMLADGLEKVSRERIGAEMTRLIADFDAAPVIGAMEQSGVLLQILPGASALTLARLIDLEEQYPIEGRMLRPKDVPTRLAALGCDDVEERLRLSKADAKKVALVKQEAGKTTPSHELGYRHGYLPAVHCLLLRWASLLQPFDESALEDIWLGAEASFPINAADLMPTYSGKALGDRLNQLEDVWLKSKFSATKDELLRLP